MIVRMACLVVLVAIFAGSFSVMVQAKRSLSARTFAGEPTATCGTGRSSSCIPGSTSGLF